MYFDYIVLGLIIWGVTDAFFGPDDADDAESGESVPDTTTDPDLVDGGDLLDDAPIDEETVTEDADTDDVEDDETIGDDFVDDTTTVTVDTAGEISTSTFTDVELGIAPTISGTEFDDTITATDTTGFPLNLNGGAGDDAINFGYGANVDGGAGTDALSLSVTANALASDEDVGTIDMTDTQDALAVNFADDTPEFLHTVRGQTFTDTDGGQIRTVWVDYYLSDTAELGADDLTDNRTYAPDDATRVFRAIIGTGPADTPLVVNNVAQIDTNRTLATSVSDQS